MEVLKQPSVWISAAFGILLGFGGTVLSLYLGQELGRLLVVLLVMTAMSFASVGATLLLSARSKQHKGGEAHQDKPAA